MKRLLLTLLAAIALPTAVNANPFSGDIVDKTLLGEKYIVKKTTIKIMEPYTIQNSFDFLKERPVFLTEMVEKIQGFIDEWEGKYEDCLATRKRDYCDVVQNYPKTIAMWEKDKAKHEEYEQEEKDRVTKFAPAFKKYSPNKVISIEIKYTPIFEDLNGKKSVQNESSVYCYNESIDLSSINIKNENLNSLERKICKKYAKF